MNSTKAESKKKKKPTIDVVKRHNASIVKCERSSNSPKRIRLSTTVSPLKSEDGFTPKNDNLPSNFFSSMICKKKLFDKLKPNTLFLSLRSIIDKLDHSSQCSKKAFNNFAIRRNMKKNNLMVNLNHMLLDCHVILIRLFIIIKSIQTLLCSIRHRIVVVSLKISCFWISMI